LDEPFRHGLPGKVKSVTARGRTISAAGATDPGRIRLDNEDRFYVDVERGIYLVADGVGGHVAGEVAATIACDVIVRRLERLTGTAEQRVREAITLANNEIVRQAAASPAYAGMTCVVTLAVVDDDCLTIGHVGDSRLYLLTPRGISKLTHDHSPVGEREDAQEISELDAMRHPRRNEVFRDVGSRLREPDDPDFIEVIVTRFDEDSAMLLCSDGLSDMLATTVIERTVRQRAGDPGVVAQALIDAANDAGGKDNVTAVYVEGPRFAEVQEGKVGDGQTLRSGRARVPNGVTWRTLGILLGVGIGLAIPFLMALMPLDIPLLPRRPRTLVVGGIGSDRFSTIDVALRVARPGDVVQLEPGAYAEALVLPDGVDLVAKEPGTAVLVAPLSRPEWVGLTIGGRLGNRVSGLRIRGQPDAPMTVGVRLAGHNVVIDDVAIEGTIGVGVDVERDGAILVRGCRFSAVAGVPLRIGAKARPQIRQSLFVQPAGGGLAAIEIAAEAKPELVDNLLVGYSEGIRAPSGQWTPAQLEQLFRGNYRIRSADPAR
jgi:serine/threonine protein phosphatase PrpC